MKIIYCDLMDFGHITCAGDAVNCFITDRPALINLYVSVNSHLLPP